MGKYTLVASSYDPIHNRFFDEVAIKLVGGPQNELVQIDRYTASSSKIEILRELKEKGLIQDQDTLSIRYLKLKDSKPVYYNVVFDNPNLIHSMENLTEKKYYHDFSKVSLSLRFDDPYFEMEWKQLKNLIELKKVAEIEEKYKKLTHLIFLIHRYLNSFYDDDLVREQGLKEIELEFSRYKTFRGWIVEKNKKKKKILTSNNSAKKIKKRIDPISKESAETEFEKSFMKKNLLDYKHYLLNQYNQQDMDKEEFIEEDELEQMGYMENYDKRK